MVLTRAKVGKDAPSLPSGRCELPAGESIYKPKPISISEQNVLLIHKLLSSQATQDLGDYAGERQSEELRTRADTHFR